MTRRPLPGPAATPEQHRRAEERAELLRTELARIRSAALAWRNGLAALLTGLIGFGLVKGRSDVSTLDHRWAVAVGLILLAALVGGAVGAALLLRAAHGRFGVVPLSKVPPLDVGNHLEAVASAHALKRGIVATLTCAALLVVAVAATWYGPAKEDPRLRLDFTGGTACGKVLRIANGAVVIEAENGELTVPLDQLRAVKPVDACSPAKP